MLRVLQLVINIMMRIANIKFNVTQKIPITSIETTIYNS